MALTATTQMDHQRRPLIELPIPPAPSSATTPTLLTVTTPTAHCSNTTPPIGSNVFARSHTTVTDSKQTMQGCSQERAAVLDCLFEQCVVVLLLWRLFGRPGVVDVRSRTAASSPTLPLSLRLASTTTSGGRPKLARNCAVVLALSEFAAADTTAAPAPAPALVVVVVVIEDAVTAAACCFFWRTCNSAMVSRMGWRAAAATCSSVDHSRSVKLSCTLVHSNMTTLWRVPAYSNSPMQSGGDKINSGSSSFFSATCRRSLIFGVKPVIATVGRGYGYGARGSQKYQSGPLPNPLVGAKE